MRATTVRFSEDLWKQLEGEAAREGVSAAQFVRDATVMRLAYLMGRRGDAGLEAILDRLAGTGEDGGRGEGANGHGHDSPAAQALAAAAAALRDPARLGALHASGLLDTPAEPAFDRVARLAAEVLNAPVALVSLLDADRQFFKSCLGLPEPWASQRETPLSHSFCQHAVTRREPLVVSDAREDPVLRDNPAIRDLGVIAYAGVPLIDDDGQALGTLCVIDSRPRQWSRHQIALLTDLAASVVSEVALARRRGNGTRARSRG